MAGFKACEALRHPVATRDSPEISASSLKPVIPRRRTSSSLLLLLSHHQGSRSSRLVFTFLRATCQLVPTLTLGCYAHFEQLETRHGTCNWIPVFTFKSILDELCVAHVRLPMHSLHLTAAIPFPFRVSFRSRSSPNYVSVSEDRFLFRYPTLPARGEIESAFERRKRHEAAKWFPWLRFAIGGTHGIVRDWLRGNEKRREEKRRERER